MANVFTTNLGTGFSSDVLFGLELKFLETGDPSGQYYELYTIMDGPARPTDLSNFEKIRYTFTGDLSSSPGNLTQISIVGGPSQGAVLQFDPPVTGPATSSEVVPFITTFLKWPASVDAPSDAPAIHLAGNDTFSGSNQSDVLRSYGGRDRLSGGLGNDTLSGGDGGDTFLGTVAELAGDTLTDFEAGDTIFVAGVDLSGVGGHDVIATLTLAGSQTLTLSNLPAGWIWNAKYQQGVGTFLRLETTPGIVADQALSIAENSSAGSVVGTALAADIDEDIVAGFAITGGTGKDLFAIDSTGKITVSPGAALNYEGTSSYTLTLTATDGKSTSAEQTITINVADVNEAPTLSALSSVQKAESLAVGSHIATAVSSDPDVGGDDNADNAFEDLVYSLVNSFDGTFVIDPATGAITLAKPFDYEVTRSYDLEVRVTDGGVLTNSKAFTLGITDVNEAPTAVSLGNQVTSMAENGAAVKVADVTVTDDGLGTETLSLIGTDAGSFEIRGTELWFRGGADFETEASYSVQVKATDEEGLSATSATFTLGISDTPDTATSGKDVLFLGAGDNFLNAGDGNDQVDGQAGNDNLRGADGNDTLLGSDGNDVLRASRGSDRLDGGAGNDVLKGGPDADALVGGEGADKFVFRSWRDSPADGFDRILDFSQAEGDRIDLSGFQGDLSWRGERGFTGAGNEVRFEQKRGDTLVLADLDGDGRADFKIKLEGLIDLRLGDFLL